MCPKDIHILELLELCAQLPPRSKAVGMKLGQGGQGSLVTSQTSLTGSKSPKLPQELMDLGDVSGQIIKIHAGPILGYFVHP